MWRMAVKNVLFIVTEINSANGICSKAVMNELSSAGYNVFCIVNKENELPEGHYTENDIQYYTVKPRLVYRLENKLNVMEKGIKKKCLACFTVAINKTKLFFSIPSWPLISPLYAYRIYKKARLVCKNENIDIIVPVYTKMDALIAAKRIKKENPKIKYFPYFLDSLSGGYGPRMFSKEWIIKRGLKWEKRLLTTADKIILMKSSEEHHKKHSINREYYKKMVFLDLPLFMPDKYEEETNSSNGEIKELLFIGTILVQVRSPQKFFEVFRLINGDNYRLTIVGTNNCPELIDKAIKADRRITVLPFVTHERAKELMSSADFLVNFGNNDVSMTPSKIFEYMSTGRPIISTVPVENEPGTHYLKKYPMYCMLNEYCESTEEMAENLRAFLESPKENRAEVNYLMDDFYLNTPKAFAECINN